jgi:quercetin dioxygenase-like cupin family protein
MRRALLIALVTGLSFAAAGPSASADEPAHVLLNPGDIKWGDAPPVFPPGAKMAVLFGDPAKPGLFIVRVRMPGGYIVPAHWHSSDEVVSIVRGSGAFGLGDKFDRAQLHTLTTGGFIVAPAKHNHFAMTKDGMIIQIAATGPFDMNYVDPKDDPRNKAGK